MKHLLLARFQGVLLGGNTIYLTPQQMKPNQLMVDNLSAIVGGVESLIRRGGFNREDWLQSTLSTIDRPAQAIVTSIPLMLFFHEDRARFQDIITQLNDWWNIDRATTIATIAIGYLLAAAMTENLDPQTIIPEILAELPETDPIVVEQLTTAHNLLDRAASLHQVVSTFTPAAHPMVTAIALASYCFLSIPADYSLALRRANGVKHQNQLLCALTGILAGAHNSLTGIPIGGYLATPGREQLIRLSEQLFAVWSGSYHSDRPFPLPLSLVAAPRVIQRR
jgi:hypothetical protein